MQKIWNEFYQYIEAIDSCHELASVSATCEQYFKILNIKYFHYVWQPSAVVSDANKITFGNCEKCWVDKCDQYNLALIQDSPFIQRPLEWELNADEVPKDRRNMIIGGVIIPIRGIAGSQAKLYIFYRKTTYVHNKMLPLLENWAIHMHNQVEKIHADDYMQAPLTKREKGILNLTIVGKTASEIGTIVGIETSTVNFHLTNLRKKFEVYNKTHLIAKALTLNFDYVSMSSNSANLE